MQIVPETERKQAEAMTYSHRCAVCQAGIVLCWGGFWNINSHVLRCSADAQHEGFEKPYRIPLSQSGIAYMKTSKKEVERMTQEQGQAAMTKLQVYQSRGELTQAEAELVCQTLWPKAPDGDRVKAAMVCAQYGLNPLMRHVFLIPFKDEWVLVMGIQATRLIAARGMSYSYMDDTPRVMTDAEQMKKFGKVDKDKIWAITKLRRRDGMEAPGYGSWPKSQQPLGLDKGNTQENMAFIRSERNALDRCAPGAIPKGVEVVEEAHLPEFEPVTGEIVEAEVVTERDLADPCDTAAEVVLASECINQRSYLDGKYGDMLANCWEHREPWHLDDYRQLCHIMPDKTYCHLRKLLKPITEGIAQKLGITSDDINERAKKANQGKAWSKISDQGQLEILTVLYAQIPVKDKDNQGPPEADEGEGQGELL